MTVHHTIMLVLTLVTSLAVLNVAEPCTQGVTLVTPRIAVAGRRTSVLVTLHGSAGRSPLNVTARLTVQPAGGEEELPELIARDTALVTGHGLVQLNIPLSAAGKFAVLQVLANCSAGGEESEDCALIANTALRIAQRVREVVIAPDSPRYHPGETIHFWLVALDYDLNVPNDVTGNVWVRDPRGNKVAVWPEVNFSQGVRGFSMLLGEEAEAGAWWLEIEMAGTLFNTAVNVSQGRAGMDQAPTQPMAEEHFVELRFGREMRRLYKPGLPFVGKVEALSTEANMRVRVKVYDNTTAIYSQDVEIAAGEGTFLVPAILADSEVITFQAELVSVAGKEIDSHYVLAREPVRKWNSSSDCYILIEGVERTMKVYMSSDDNSSEITMVFPTLQPGEEARAVVLSTCPCEKGLHIVVTTEGHITHAAERRVEEPSEKPQQPEDVPTPSIDGAAICRINFSFPVSPVMAPVSHLLVYYVTEEGEPVSDVTSFGVHLLMNEPSLSVEHRAAWGVGAPVETQLLGARNGDLVCLVGGREHEAEPRRPRSHPHGTPSTPPEPPPPAGDLDFKEAQVSFFQRLCSAGHITFRQQDGGSGVGNGGSSLWRGANSARAHDRLWLWQCVNYTSSVASSGMSVPGPPDSGIWTMWAFSLSPRSGLRFSPPQRINVFQALETQFMLPPTLRVGEVVEVPVKITNNLNSCLDITALLALTEGAHFISNHVLYLTERLRLGPLGATSLVVRVAVTKAGLKNMTAEVTGFRSDSCHGVQDGGEDERSADVTSSSSLVGSVLRSATMTVLPEGIVRSNSESAYFCANENLLVSPAEESQFEFVSAPRSGLVFEVQTSSGALVALSDSRYVTPDSTLVVLGNEESWIGRGRHEYGLRLTSTTTPGLLSGAEFRAFWVTYSDGIAAVGQGHVLHNNTLLRWPLPESISIAHIGFASAWGTPAQFRVWNYNEEAGFSQVLHLDVPPALVPGTDQGMLLVAGGLYLPRRDDEGQEDEAGGLHAALNAFSSLHELRAREASGDDGGAARVEEIRTAYPKLQTLLSFRTKDGAFGDHPDVPDFSGSVAVLETLDTLQAYIDVDPELLTSLKMWLLAQQCKDGSFSATARAEPDSFLLSGWTEQVSMEQHQPIIMNLTEEDSSKLAASIYYTGQAVVALVRLGLESEVDTAAALRARYFLERTVFHVTEPRALSLLALALTRTHSDLAAAARDRFRRQASNEEGDFAWPHGDEVVAPERNVAEFEASLWALMTYTALGDLRAAEPVAKYLFYRWTLLDTHAELRSLAVRATSTFSLLARDANRQLTVSLATAGMELTDTLELRADTPGPARLLLPGLPTRVFVYSTGAGCATVQGRVVYSTYAVPEDLTLPLMLWAAVIDEPIPGPEEEISSHYPNVRLRACVQAREHAQLDVPIRLEVQLFSGYEAESIEVAGDDVSWGSHYQDTWAIFKELTPGCARCMTVTGKSESVVTSLRPALARVFPAGRPYETVRRFMHATRRDSHLLDGYTEEDLDTWFGSNGEGALGSNMTSVCECPCPHASTTTVPVATTSAVTVSTIPPTTPSTSALPDTTSKLPLTFTSESVKAPTEKITVTSVTQESVSTNTPIVSMTRVVTSTVPSSTTKSSTVTPAVTSPRSIGKGPARLFNLPNRKTQAITNKPVPTKMIELDTHKYTIENKLK